MILLLLYCTLLPALTSSSVIDETNALIALEDYDDNEFSCMDEMVELSIEDLFLEYPSVKPSSRGEVIVLKKNYGTFLKMDEDLQNELIDGASMGMTVLEKFLGDLKEIALQEWNNSTKLSVEERKFLETVNYFVRHKIVVQRWLKYTGQKKAQFLASGMSKQEFLNKMNSKCGSITLLWDVDADYAKTDKTSERAKGIKHWLGSNGDRNEFKVYFVDPKEGAEDEPEATIHIKNYEL